jgi:predicted negative regulator of RcsB-dependent stress response
MSSMRTIVIAALIVAVAVLGYLYYQRTQNDITIQLPKVQVNP